MRRVRTGMIGLVAAMLLPSAALATSCTGDCGGAGMPTAEDVLAVVGLALAGDSPETCAAADFDGDDAVTVDEVLRAVRFSLEGCPSQVPPTGSAQIFAWLGEGDYLDWRSESAVHPSVGPHFGRVRTFVNDDVFSSLAAGQEAHPVGAALVKELYGGNGDDVRGWAVMVKTAEESGDGRGWYWYERFGSSTFASANVAPGCYGCHGTPPYQGITSKDYVLTPFPLQ